MLNLINQKNGTILAFSKFIFCVYQYQAMFQSHALQHEWNSKTG